MSIKTTSLGDLPRDGVRQPDPVILPVPATLFSRRADRLRVLLVAHPMADWLRFLAQIAGAQAASVSETPLPAPLPTPFDLAAIPLDLGWDATLRAFAPIADDPAFPEAARATLRRLPDLDTRALARDWLAGDLATTWAGESIVLAAALQVVFARHAAALDATAVRLLPQRGLCPVCASPPVAGVITAKGRSPGARYLHCGLCATAWNHVRAVCTGCGEAKGLALREIEGGSGAIKAETCDVCRGYAKMFYQEKDTAIEPLADDLASLGLDLMVSDAGWSRLGINPLLGMTGVAP
ncbi:MAG TPA: formate dehydrogenase accessory protein FdhE [Rhodopila sp.]|uniref:formate dehydrogenase accessory protein FdhE n=1 Tax=Rhodopila sp. TaxID=2480087 RepID=UPI002C74908E|nr:formate dehydrogenase accessory protein FdhE [Rhodopila sp.]HVY18135.1 formate dehydrogenase accessory protein FdhE [Rhodopila sp.]